MGKLSALHGSHFSFKFCQSSASSLHNEHILQDLLILPYSMEWFFRKHLYILTQIIHSILGKLENKDKQNETLKPSLLTDFLTGIL